VRRDAERGLRDMGTLIIHPRATSLLVRSVLDISCQQTKLQPKLEAEASHTAPQQKRRADKDKLSCNRDGDFNWERLAAFAFTFGVG